MQRRVISDFFVVTVAEKICHKEYEAFDIISQGLSIVKISLIILHAAVTPSAHPYFTNTT